MNNDICVSIICLTYNHERYIRQCIEGFLMQKTNFRFQIIIHDDHSTDNTLEIVESYSKAANNIILLPEPENVYSKYGFWGIFNIIKPHISGKYIAFCEGDDYWIEPDKLQKQVEYLKTHPECSLCCTNAEILTANKTLNWTRYHKSRIIPVKDLILGGGLWVQTASFVFKKDILINWPGCCKQCHVGDYPLILWAALNGYVYYLDEKSAVYRYQSDGSWTARQGSMETNKKVPGWISELRMLKGLDEYSQHRFNKYFEGRQVKYLFLIFMEYRYDPHQFISDFNDYLDNLPLLFRYYIKVCLNYNYSHIYVRIIKRICAFIYA